MLFHHALVEQELVPNQATNGRDARVKSLLRVDQFEPKTKTLLCAFVFLYACTYRRCVLRNPQQIIFL